MWLDLFNDECLWNSSKPAIVRDLSITHNATTAEYLAADRLTYGIQLNSCGAVTWSQLVFTWSAVYLHSIRHRALIVCGWSVRRICSVARSLIETLIIDSFDKQNNSNLGVKNTTCFTCAHIFLKEKRRAWSLHHETIKEAIKFERCINQVRLRDNEWIKATLLNYNLCNKGVK